jgi:hypothetical protein
MAFQYFGKSTPIEQGNKVISTFPSGLCLVQQSYMIRKVDEEIYRNEFASGSTLDIVSHAVDGLYIFPDPQWRDGGNGFMEIAISAYGRSNTVGKTEISAIIRDAVINIYPPVGNLIEDVERVIASYIKFKIVVQSGTFPEINLNDLRELITIRNTDGSEITYALGTTEILFNLGITRYDITNFGLWDELTITIEPITILIIQNYIP